MAPAERSRSARELIEHEEQEALAALRDSLVAAGEDLCALDEVRAFARRHPALAVAASAAAGAALAPLLARVAGAAMPLLGPGLASANRVRKLVEGGSRETQP